MGGHDFRFAEKISLEIQEALIARQMKFFVGFDFLRLHAAAPGAVALDHRAAFLERRALEVHLENIGPVHQRLARVVSDEVIERDQISGLSQALTGGQD